MEPVVVNFKGPGWISLLGIRPFYLGIEKSFYNTTGIQRAKWESGLDNSPMHDHIPFDSIHTHMMALADVGLMSIYVADCNALAFIASETGRTKEKKELLERGEKYKQKLNTLTPVLSFTLS